MSTEINIAAGKPYYSTTVGIFEPMYLHGVWIGTLSFIPTENADICL